MSGSHGSKQYENIAVMLLCVIRFCVSKIVLLLDEFYVLVKLPYAVVLTIRAAIFLKNFMS